MRVGHYDKGETSFILMYSKHTDVAVAFPPELRDKAEHIAHAVYSVDYPRSISVYTIPASCMPELKSVELARSLSHQPMDQEKLVRIVRDFGINATILDSAPAEALEIICRDVEVYAKSKGVKQGKHLLSPAVGYVTKAELKEHLKKLQPRFTGEAVISGSGKQDYIPSCLIDINLDFCSEGCFSTHHGVYYDPFAKCSYCYAKSHQTDTPFKSLKTASAELLVEQIKDLTLERKLEGKETSFLRLGKISEVGSKFTREQLFAALEACAITGVKPIFPTKFLEFDNGLAELLRRTSAALLYSIGNDRLEPGAAAAGCGNDFRFEQAAAYYDRMVNAGLYLLIDAINFENPLFSQNIQRALELQKRTGIQVQFLPIRPFGKLQLEQICGDSAKDLLAGGQRRLFGMSDSPGGYERMNNNQYSAKKVDERFKKLIVPGKISMCHHNSECTWCGGCLHKPHTSFPTEKTSPETVRKR